MQIRAVKNLQAMGCYIATDMGHFARWRHRLAAYSKATAMRLATTEDIRAATTMRLEAAAAARLERDARPTEAEEESKDGAEAEGKDGAGDAPRPR